MLRLIQAALLPKDIILKGLQIARDCSICQSQQRHLHAPTIKSQRPTIFNVVVQHDLFFMRDSTFMLLIDEAIRWKTGDQIENKLGPTLARALRRLWIRLWGAMRHLLSDQEGGLLNDEATRMFDRLSIVRLLVGRDGSSTKGLVERRIALTKIGMLKLQKELQSAGINITAGEICQEACMSQNLLLEYNGGTPQMALTGVEQR
eukprot:6700099-Pyramimonas_sp.AAC.1